MEKKVVIDCFPESAPAYAQGYAVVVIDVIRATTSAITVAGRGGRCLPVTSIEAAHKLAARLDRPLLAGELGGAIPPGFEMNNSPAELDLLVDISRPVILLSSSGTKLLHEARKSDVVHLACLRNYRFLARHLADHYSRVAVIGAGSLGDFREEDQMCCAWIARDLIEEGFAPENHATTEIVKRWSAEEPTAIIQGKSAAYLRRSGQIKDLDFILDHINDLNTAFVFKNDEVVILPAEDSRPAAFPAEVVNADRAALNVCSALKTLPLR